MSRYVPSDMTIRHMIWRISNFTEDNKTPKFHYQMLDHYFSTGSYIKPIKAFRGSAKSTNTCYVALHRSENVDAHYTLIISDTATQAEALIADISDMLRESSLSYKVIRDVVGEIELVVNGKRYFIVGKGAGSSMRGIKRNRKRPDLIILDDIINDELVMNRLRIDRLNRWFYKALLPSSSPNGEIYAVGTPLSQNDLFMHLCSLHPTIEIPLTNGVWSDRFSDEWIANKKAEYKKAGMLREYKGEFELILTDSETQLFDMKKIKFIDEDEMSGLELTWFMTCDLAFSEKTSADLSALMCVGIDDNGNWFVYGSGGRWKPSQTAQKIVDLVSRFGIDVVGIEGGASYLAVNEHLERLQLEQEVYFGIIETKHGGRSKLSRVSALEPIVNSGRMNIVDNGEIAEQLIEQFELTDNHSISSVHDDCFSGDTLVEVNGSIMRFDEIPSEGYVTGYDGKQVRYINGGVRDRRFDLYSIKLNDGRVIKATPNHEFLTFEDGKYEWVKTINLSGKTLCQVKPLMDVNTVSAQTNTITKHQEMEKAEPVCTETYGNQSMVKYLLDLLYTTKTTIDRITTYLTLSLWKAQNINLITLKSGIKRMITTENISTVSDILPKSGTNQKRAENGIGNMLSEELDQDMTLCAHGVEKSIEVLSQAKLINSALYRAEQRREEIAELMTLNENVKHVENILQSTKTIREKIVVANVGLLAESQIVYCLEIPSDSCFSLANDVIVSNCIDALSIMASGEMRPYYSSNIEVTDEVPEEDKQYGGEYFEE